jgi:hypothetical protein
VRGDVSRQNRAICILAGAIIKRWLRDVESVKQAFDANIGIKNNHLLTGVTDLNERYKRLFEALI